jgi:hypothetical protein
MTLSKLTVKEQVIVGITLFVILISVYSFVRFLPKNEEIARTKTTIEKTERKLLRAEIPDEPVESLNALQVKLDDQELAMALIRNEATLIEQSLAAFDSQEIRVRISQLARQSNLRIRVNEVLKTLPQRAVSSNKKKKKSKSAVQPTHNQILPETMSWIARMSEGTVFHRPMQRMELIGDFESVQRFIYGLEQLPWQTTVLRIKIAKMPTDSPYGYTQQLVTELVIAL